MKSYLTIEGITYTTDTTKAFKDTMRDALHKLRWCDGWTYESIWDAYENPSREKEKAWNDWRMESIHLNADKIRVIGKNCNFFSIAYTFEYEGAEYIAYITAFQNCIAKVDEL